MLRQSTKQLRADKPERAQETLSVDIPKGVPKEILAVCAEGCDPIGVNAGRGDWY
jgi:hypothetical protein